MEDHLWRQERQAYHQRLAKFGATPLLDMRNAEGTILLSHADFDAYEGPYEKEPFLRLHMCTARIGRLCRIGADGRRLEGILRPGSVGITLPNYEAEGYWPRTKALAIMVQEGYLCEISSGQITVDRLEPAVATLHRDRLVSSAMYAMWRDAELHGLSSAFFDHGLATVLNRISELGHSTVRKTDRRFPPLSRRTLQRILELMEGRVGDDIRVSDLADECDMEIRGFTRSFRTSTGFAPYEYLTLRRMERAKSLLKSGMPVTEVALSVGYSNPSKFSAAFRRLNGYTPLRWLREQF